MGTLHTSELYRHAVSLHQKLCRERHISPCPHPTRSDSQVAARHLHHFGYSVHVCYPKPTPKPLYQELARAINQCAGIKRSIQLSVIRCCVRRIL